MRRSGGITHRFATEFPRRAALSAALEGMKRGNSWFPHGVHSGTKNNKRGVINGVEQTWLGGARSPGMGMAECARTRHDRTTDQVRDTRRGENARLYVLLSWYLPSRENPCGDAIGDRRGGDDRCLALR